MIEQHNNSVIYRDVDEERILDFSHIGSNVNANEIVLTEPNHYFILGDAIFYDIYSNHYRRALANNSIMSEVIGVVSEIIDINTFKLTLKGNIILDRYSNIQEGSFLYLSPLITGKLIPDEPENVSKIIAVKIQNGIKVDIQRGYHLKADQLINNSSNVPQYEEYVDYSDLRYYTDQELQDIIVRITNDIY